MTPLAAQAPEPDARLAIVLVVLLGIAVVASRFGGLGVGKEQTWAGLRAVIQLGVVALVLAFALRSWVWSSAFAALMLVVASATATRRLDLSVDPRRRSVWLIGACHLVAVVPVLALILGSGLIPFNGPGIVPTAGIIIGGTMIASTLIGRRAFAELKDRQGIYEAWLTVGFSSPQAVRRIIVPTAREGLIPGIDQTRTVGLVTLPGAFVGVLLGGGTPWQAGAAQIIVLIGLLASQAIAAAALQALIAEGLVMAPELNGRVPRTGR